jgi:3-oxoacyl-[acyl-carrier protein] reductase
VVQELAQELAGRVAIVTGASSRIGGAVARGLAAAGASVVLTARTREPLDELALSIGAGGGCATAVPADLRDATAAEALGARVLALHGRIDVLAALAGGGGVDVPLDRLDPAAWQEIFARNVTTCFHAARAVLPAMRRSGRGVILTCAGGGAFHPVVGAHLNAYACAKAAVCRLTDQLQAELLDTGVRVLGIEPSGVPPEQAAELAVWLASDRSEPLRGRIVAATDAWWRDRERVLEVERTVHLYRLRRATFD